MKPKKLSPFAASRLQVSLATFFLAAGIPVISQAAPQTWSGATNADWNTITNWTSAIPTASDVATFDATSTANLAVTLGIHSKAAGLSVVSPAAAVSIASTIANTLPGSALAVTPSSATDVFTYAPVTPLANGNRVHFTATTFPTGMAAGIDYYVINATATTFQISLTAGGAAVNYSANGTATNGTAVVVNGSIMANNATDVLTYGSTLSTPMGNGDLISFNANTMPTGLVVASYFVVNSTATTFQVALTLGGTPVDFTTDGAALRGNGNNAQRLTIGASGVAMASATQNLTLSTPAVLSGAQTWNIAAGRTATVSGFYMGNQGNPLTINGPGAVTFSGGSMDSTGGITITGATVNLNAGSFVSALGASVASSGVITFDGGTLSHLTGGTPTSFTCSPVFVDAGKTGTINFSTRTQWGGVGNNPPVTGTGTLTLNIGSNTPRDDFYANFSGFQGTAKVVGTVAGAAIRYFASSGASLSAGAVWDIGSTGTTVSIQPQTNSGGNTVNIGALKGGVNGTLAGGTNGSPTYSIGALSQNTVFDGGITGNAIVTKVGTGTLTLTNTTALTYTGATTITEGTLKINGVKSGTAATTVNGTTTTGTLTGTGSLAGTTTVGIGAHLAPGDSDVASGVGNITLSNLTLATGSYLDLQFGVGNDTVTIPSGGALTLGTGINVDVNGFGTPGTYPIINYTGAIATSGLNAINVDGSKTYSFTSNGTVISLVISTTDPSNYWAVDSDGAWGLASNWSKNLVPNTSGALALLGPYVGAGTPGSTFSINPHISLDTVRTVGDLRLNDNETFISFFLEPGTSGSLSMNNGASPSSISSVFGTHYISAPVAVDSDGVIIDLPTADGANHNLTISGVISGASAAVTKTGAGRLNLTGSNTYGGGTAINGGVLQINSATSLGSAAANFTGGSLTLLTDIATDARVYKVGGANNAIFDTNGFNYGLTSGIAPLSGGTGGIVKNSAGTLTLSGASTYTGGTTVNSGTIDLTTGGSISAGALTLNTGTPKLLVSGGSFTSGAVSTIAGASVGLQVTSGSAAFNAGLNGNTGNASSNIFIHLSGGTFSSSFVTMGRSAGTITTPTAGSNTAGLYLDGGTATITGALNVGFSNTSVNSSASARIDSGSLTVGGAVLVAISSPNRWSVLDVNGGTFTSTDAVTGVQIGSGQVGSNAFLVRAGTATVERFLLTQPAASTLTSQLHVTGGTLYVGAGGIVGNVNGGTGILDIQLGTATLGAKADWASSLAMTVADTTLQAADAASAAHNFALSGVISGTNLTKTGAGKVTLSGANTYTGITTITEGNLSINGDNSLATGDVNVASGATIGGNGNLGGNVNISSGGHHGLAVGATPATQATRIITGILTLTGGTSVDISAAVAPAGGVYTLATANGGIVGSLPALNLPVGVTGSLAIVGNSLKLTVIGGYSSWAADPANGLTAGVNDGPTQDPDNDGIKNLLEYVLGGLPMASSTGVLPVMTTTATDFVFTFNRNDVSEGDTALIFQYGTNLSTWTNVAIGATSSLPVVNVSEASTSPDVITITIPKSNAVDGKLFGRLDAVR